MDKVWGGEGGGEGGGWKGEVFGGRKERKRKETANDSDKQQTAFVSRRLYLWISDADVWISDADARRCHRRDLHQ